jgi:enamine deaminase RidA (YjgF/YER057c/UK114 family)
VNPWEWSLQFGFNQSEVVEGQTKVLVCAGQTALDGDGTPQHSGDMAAQIALALDNLEAVLAGAGMRLGDVVRLNMYPLTSMPLSSTPRCWVSAPAPRVSCHQAACSVSLGLPSRSS